MTAPADRAARPTARGTAVDPHAPRALPARWLWLAAAPMAWALHELVSYAGSSVACHVGDTGVPRLFGVPAPNVVVGAVSLLALAAAVLATARLWRWWRAHPGPPTDGADELVRRAERLRFLALLSVALGMLCVYGVLLAATATFLRGCT